MTAVIKPPEHPVGPAFEKALEWQAEQERQLTDTQRRAFEEIKSRQALARRRDQERIEVVRAQLQQKAKNRKPKGELNFNPPHLIADPYIRRQARFVIAAEKRLEKLDRTHLEERHKALKEFERDRTFAKTKERAKEDFANSWKEAVKKTAQQEGVNERDRSKFEDYDKTR